MLKEPFAEFLGTALIIIFGTGVVCQVVLSGNTGVASGPKGVGNFFTVFPPYTDISPGLSLHQS